LNGWLSLGGSHQNPVSVGRFALQVVFQWLLAISDITLGNALEFESGRKTDWRLFEANKSGPLLLGFDHL